MGGERACSKKEAEVGFKEGKFEKGDSGGKEERAIASALAWELGCPGNDDSQGGHASKLAL